MSHASTEVQTIMFSATMGKEVNKLVSITTKKPIRVSADPDNVNINFIIENSLKTTSTSHKTQIRNIILSIGSFTFCSN